MFEKKSNFAANLKNIRLKRKMTQAELGERAGIVSAAISHFETGLRMPSPENLKKLAEALDVSIDYLLGVEEIPTPKGPRIQAVFRNLQELSDEAIEQLEAFSKHLAERDQKKKKKRNE